MADVVSVLPFKTELQSYAWSDGVIAGWITT